MKFTVLWRTSAEDELLQLWLDAASREEVTAACREIDLALAADPWE